MHSIVKACGCGRTAVLPTEQPPASPCRLVDDRRWSLPACRSPKLTTQARESLVGRCVHARGSPTGHHGRSVATTPRSSNNHQRWWPTGSGATVPCHGLCSAVQQPKLDGVTIAHLTGLRCGVVMVWWEHFGRRVGVRSVSASDGEVTPRLSLWGRFTVPSCSEGAGRRSGCDPVALVMSTRRLAAPRRRRSQRIRISVPMWQVGRELSYIRSAATACSLRVPVTLHEPGKSDS